VNPRLLLLGLGNDILTDDAIGLRVAAAVKERLADRPQVTVLASQEMGSPCWMPSWVSTISCS